MSAPSDPLAQDPWLNEASKSRRQIPTWAIVVIACCAAFGGCFVLSRLPVIALRAWAKQSEPRVAPGAELPDDDLDWLHEGKFVDADESVLYFSSRGARGGRGGYSRHFVTDRRVISCSRGSIGDVRVHRASYEDILRADTRSDGIPAIRICIDIETVGMREMTLEAQLAEGREREFERVFREQWRAGRARAIDGLRENGSMTIERQIEILRRFGIALPIDVSIDGLLSAHSQADFEAPPFDRLLARLGEIELESAPGRAHVGDVLRLDVDRIRDSGDLTSFAQHIRDLADGSLPIENMADTVQPSRYAQLHYEYEGELRTSYTTLEGDPIKNSIVREFAEMVAEREGGPLLASARLRDGTRVLLCIARESLRDLRHETGIDFEWVEP
jgi:hypothetical protein